MAYKIRKIVKKKLSDTITPVSIYLNIRNEFPNSLLLEGADFHGGGDSFSFICINPLVSFEVNDNTIFETLNDKIFSTLKIDDRISVPQKLDEFINQFEIVEDNSFNKVDGVFGYSSYNAIKHFENIDIGKKTNKKYSMPDMKYSFYRFIIAINHFKNELFIQENIINDNVSKIDYIESIIKRITFQISKFKMLGNESSNLNDNEFMDMVSKGKKHCRIGNVFQIVLSRQFSQQFQGDDFNVYRALRYINPSPYLFYFEYDNFKIFGSSPEAQLQIDLCKAIINPIAGTFKRTGNDKQDKELAIELSKDPKENAEHIMLVDLARNDLSRNCSNVTVEVFREIQYFSHVLHMVSKVSGKIKDNAKPVQILADTFPAGTLSGAPKYKAMELIEEIENQDRAYYGGAIGFIGLNRNINHAIMIRSFLSKNNTLFYQAGAGVVDKSVEKNELIEVNNKLMALKKALEMAEEI